MNPRVKFGIMAGSAGLVLNICVLAVSNYLTKPTESDDIAAVMALVMLVALPILFCGGPLIAALAGGAAGFYAAQQEKATTKFNAFRSGAIAGSIAGTLALVGQLIAAPAPFSTPGICIGLVGIIVATWVGAVAGDFGIRQKVSGTPSDGQSSPALELQPGQHTSVEPNRARPITADLAPGTKLNWKHMIGFAIVGLVAGTSVSSVTIILGGVATIFVHGFNTDACGGSCPAILLQWWLLCGAPLGAIVGLLAGFVVGLITPKSGGAMGSMVLAAVVGAIGGFIAGVFGSFLLFMLSFM